MIVVIDNYDSFTYNLAQYLGELGERPVVRRNDQVGVGEVLAMGPEAIVVSPGPCTPSEAGVSLDLIRAAAGRVPILGVCLGHQCVGQAFGGRVIRAPVPVHGKTSEIHHDGRTIFAGVETPFVATRYHSLIVAAEGLPENLEVSARTADGLIMGLRHRRYTVEGVQFHPESILTGPGKAILKNFLALSRRTRDDTLATPS